MNEAQLVQHKDGNAIEYRLRGTLLARCLVVTGHPQEHMVAVVKRIREFCTDLPTGPSSLDNYRAARAIWDAREDAV